MHAKRERDTHTRIHIYKERGRKKLTHLYTHVHTTQDSHTYIFIMHTCRGREIYMHTEREGEELIQSPTHNTCIHTHVHTHTHTRIAHTHTKIQKG